MGSDSKMSTIHQNRLVTGRFWPFGRKWQQWSVTVVAGILLVECGLFLSIPPATGYETSLVNALPIALWACFYVVTFGAILTVVSSVATESGYWRHSLALLLANYAIFIFLPEARGYRFYGRGKADALVHLGWVQGIVDTGSLMGSFYPGEHILLSELRMLGIPLDSIPYVSAFLFTALFILGIGAFLHTLSGDKRGLIAGLTAGMPLIFAQFHLTNHPSMNSFMLLPALLVVVERYRSTRSDGYLALFLLLGLMTIYFHPMTTIFLITIVSAIAVYARIHGVLTGNRVQPVSLRLPIVLLPLLFAWLVDFDRTEESLQKALIGQGTAPAAIEAQRVSAIEFTPLELLTKFVSRFGAVTLYLAVAGVFTAYIFQGVVRQYLRSDTSYQTWTESYSSQYGWVMPSFQFGLGTLISALFFFESFIIKGRIRVLRYALLFAVILVGLSLLYTVQKRKIRLTVVLTIIILLAAGLGANAAYQPARHMTYAEYDGTQFMLSNYELGLDIHSMDTRHAQERYILGGTGPRVYPRGFESADTLPPALGYENESVTAGDTFGRAYVVTKSHDIERPTADYYTDEQQEFLTRYGREDLDRMHSDRTANKIYTNGGFTGWSVTPSER